MKKLQSQNVRYYCGVHSSLKLKLNITFRTEEVFMWCDKKANLKNRTENKSSSIFQDTYFEIEPYVMWTTIWK